MSELGLTKSESPVPPAQPDLQPGFELRFDDTLACGQRIWVRGQICKKLEISSGNNGKSRWWRRPTLEQTAAPSPLQLQTRIGGAELTATASLNACGRFEAQLSMPLPPVRRGWRVARHQVTLGGHAVEACNVVLMPPPDAVAAVVVILPLDFTLRPADNSASPTTHSLERLGQLVQSLQPVAGPHYPIYYLAGVLADKSNAQAELGLAAAERGWPAGQLITVPVTGEGDHSPYSAAFERLRWLFAGALDLLVLNLEPRITSLPVELREPAEDWGVVRRYLDVGKESSGRSEHGRRDSKMCPVLGPRPTRAALVPRYPVVFCHGMLAFSMLKMQMPEDINCFAPLRRFLSGRGIRVLFPQVAPTGAVKERASSLRDQIQDWTSEPINIVAHSMGGLDARYLITHLGMEDRVRSLTTVCTPHRGTYLADWFLSNFRRRVPLLLALEAIGVNVNGFKDCRLAACRAFNAATPNSEKVRYFSYGGDISPSRLSPVLRRAWNILTPIEGPNDGMVSLASATWGEYLGTVHADHFAQTPDSVFLRAGEDFDTLGFYSRMIEDLARRGF